jgi:hypothetical protein
VKGYGHGPYFGENDPILFQSSDGPYCPNCGTYLGSGYNSGDECLECFEDREASEEAEREKSLFSSPTNPKE